ncbi:MAG: response regulator, partial [Christensenellales bacterium]
MSKILVVDDEKSIRVTLSEFLKRAGYEVVSADNAESALCLFDGCEFDTVLTDIVMPKGSGVSLLKEIHNRNSNAQVIMMTGEPTVETAVDAVRLKARDYLSKPIARDELLKAVRHAVSYKKLLDDKQRLERENKEQKYNLERLVEERTQKMR